MKWLIDRMNSDGAYVQMLAVKARPPRFCRRAPLIRALLLSGLSAALFSSVAATAAPAAAPAGIGHYSYLELRGIDWGNSRFFGAPARGEGLRISYGLGPHSYVSGQFDRLRFGDALSSAGYNRTGVAFGLKGTAGKVSAYLQAGFYRAMGTGSLNGSRSYYWEVAYGNRFALTRWFALLGEVYSDINPEFGSRPYGLKAGISVAFGAASLQLLANHNRDVNSLDAALRVAF